MSDASQQRFDDLARSLAENGHSRRGLLKVGLGFVGAAAAGVLPGVARAGGGNSSCVDFCKSVFPDGGSDYGHCVADAAHGEGLCFTCGPKAPPSHGPLCDTVCCAGTEVCCNHQCTSATCTGGHVFNTATCRCECPATAPVECGGTCQAPCAPPFVLDTTTCACVCPTGTVACGTGCVTPCSAPFVLDPTTCTCVCPAGTEQCNDQCVPPCQPGQTRNPTTCACEGCPGGAVECDGTCCGPGENCVNGSCVCAGGTPCNSNADCACGDCIGGVCSTATCEGRVCGNFGQCSVDQDCQCYTTPEGAGVCGCNTLCTLTTPCNATTDCPSGQICAVNSCCGAAGVCLNVCFPGACAGVGPGGLVARSLAVSKRSSGGSSPKRRSSGRAR